MVAADAIHHMWPCWQRHTSSSNRPTTLLTFVLTSSHSFALLLNHVIAPPAPIVADEPSTMIVRMTTERSVAPSTEIYPSAPARQHRPLTRNG